MIDLHAHFGREAKAVGYDDLMRVLDKDKVEIQTGDMVCLHTGFADMLLEMKKDPDEYLVHHACPTLNGRDPKLLEWVTKSNLAVLIATITASRPCPRRPASGAMRCCRCTSTACSSSASISASSGI